MKRYVAFLRGINVNGQKMIRMDALKDILRLPGFTNLVTYIQSGNVAFDATESDTAILRRTIESRLADSLGYPVPVIVRSVDELKQVIAANPFPPADNNSKLTIYVTFLADEPSADGIAAIMPFAGTGEQLIFKHKEAYMLAESYGNSKLNIALFERKLATTATARNWNTINKMVTL